MLEMLSTVMKNLMSRPATRNYPAQVRDEFKDVRGKIDIDIDNCIFCGICARKCPAIALKVDRADSSWEIKRFKCVVCNSCVEACPKKCLTMNEKREPSAYATSNYKFNKKVEEKKQEQETKAAE